MDHDSIVAPAGPEAHALQLPLFADTRLPRRPWCTEDPAWGLRVRPLPRATRLPYIQVNPPRLRFWLLFDVDRMGGALAWEQGGLPAPAWAAVSRDSGRAHLAWGLSAPVLTGDAARGRPLRYLAAVEHAFRTALGADEGYSGLITKNPLHPLWRVLVGPQKLWELGELAEYVDLPKHLPRRRPADQVGLGRNCALFDRLRVWAYAAVREHREERNFVLWQSRAYDRALDMNGDFLHPLHGKEVWHLANSVARWCWARDADARIAFRARQAARGQRGGVASGAARRELRAEDRASARLLAAQGLSTRAIGQRLGVDQSTVVRWLSEPAYRPLRPGAAAGLPGLGEG